MGEEKPLWSSDSSIRCFTSNKEVDMLDNMPLVPGGLGRASRSDVPVPDTTGVIGLLGSLCGILLIQQTTRDADSKHTTLMGSRWTC